MELYVVDFVVEHLHLRHIHHEVREVKRLQGFGPGVFYHADSAAGVDYEYSWLHYTVIRLW